MVRTRITILLVLVFLCVLPLTASAFQVVRLQPLNPAAFEKNDIRTVPLHIFSFYDSSYLGYTYTTSETERQSLAKAGLRYENIVVHLSSQPLPGTYALYRVRLGHDRYLAIGKAAMEQTIAKYGYVNEGVMGYVYPKDVLAEGNANVHQWYKPNPEDTSAGILGTLTGSGQKFSTGSHAYHYYLGGPANLSDRNYEGIHFRAWSAERVLQSVRILNPNSGTFSVGSPVTIQWQSNPARGTVHLQYTVKTATGWGQWVGIVDGLSPGGTYVWKVPAQAKGEIAIMAVWNGQSLENQEGAAYDVTDQNLIIK